MTIKTVIVYLLSCSVALAGQGMGPGPGVKGYAGGGGGGTLLVGTDTLTASNYDAADSSQGVHYDVFTAAATGNIAKGYAALQGAYDPQNCKLVVFGSTGTLLATSSAATVPTTVGDVEFSFSSGSITSGQTYYLGTTCDGYVNRGNDNTAWSSGHAAYTYASPGNITSPDATSSARGSLRIWVTN